jgi:predicted ATPase
LVAQTIEQFAVITKTHPEVLAHHWTEAREEQRAIKYLRLAGDQAAGRGAMAEAAAQHSRALELLAEMPESGERDQEELAIQISLGLAARGESL